MYRRTLAALIAASAVAAGIAGCSSGQTPAASQGHNSTLIIEDNPVSPFTKDFNPFDTNSTGTKVNAIGMIYEPLLQFNTMKPGTIYPWLAQSYKFSPDGKTITFNLRQGVKWNDGQAFSAQDVVFTFNLLKANKTINVNGINPTSVSAPDDHTVVLSFDSQQYTNLYFIGGQTYIVPQHIWSSIGDPATATDANPVGTGPYKLTQFTPQGFTLSKVSTYWQADKVKITNLQFPSYVSNTTASLALSHGQIDWAGNDIPNIQKTFVDLDKAHNKYYFAPVNVVTLQLNVTKAPLNDPAVRKAISAGIDRNQLSQIGETGYEPPATSSGGMLLPVDQRFVVPSLANDLNQDKNKVASLLQADGYSMQNGKWTKNGQTIKFTLEDPSSYSDYFEDCNLISQQLNAQGFDTSVNGTTPDAWTADYNSGNFGATLHWGKPGPSPYYQYVDWLDYRQSAPIGQTAGADMTRYNNPEALAALDQYSGTSDGAQQQDALTKLQQILANEAPVIPLLYGAAWDEYSTKKFTGWPTADNPYMNPTPNSPFMEYTVLQLTPVS